MVLHYVETGKVKIGKLTFCYIGPLWTLPLFIYDPVHQNLGYIYLNTYQTLCVSCS